MDGPCLNYLCWLWQSLEKWSNLIFWWIFKCRLSCFTWKHQIYFSYFVVEAKSKNERHLHLVAHIFAKSSQNVKVFKECSSIGISGILLLTINDWIILSPPLNVCVINTQILMRQHARHACKLWNAFWFYNVFGEFCDIKGCPRPISTSPTKKRIVCLSTI